VTNCCTNVWVHDVITCADLYYDRLRGLGVAGGQILGFSIDVLRRPYNTLALPCECVIKRLRSFVLISRSNCPRNYLEDIYPCAKFHCNIFTGSLPQICEILRFCDSFVVLSCPVQFCPVLSWLYFFFSQLRPGRTPGRNLTIYGLNDA